MRDTLTQDVAAARRACRVLGQARSAQRRSACATDDEPQLVKRSVWMASEYGRYGYPRITASLGAKRWCVKHKRVEPNLAIGGPERASEASKAAKALARRWFVRKGVPGHIRSDNGSEFTAKRVREWLGRVGGEDALRGARIPVDERLHREFQRETAG